MMNVYHNGNEKKNKIDFAEPNATTSDFRRLFSNHNSFDIPIVMQIWFNAENCQEDIAELCI